MEGKNYIIIMLIVISHLTVEASNRENILQAYISGDMSKWKEIIDRMELQKRDSPAFILELLNYQYGYIGYSLGSGKRDEARTYLDLANENLSKLMDAGYRPALIHAYRSALYGFEIGLRRIKAPILGPRSVDNARRAMELDGSEPLGYIHYGNTQYYLPAIFGGSKYTALEYYRKAEELFERDPEAARKNWVYLNLLVVMAMAYEELGYYEMAKDYYEKGLEAAPDFSWVKDELYPRLLRENFP